MIYGIGLKGPEPSWEAVPGRTVLQDTDALYQAGVLDEPVEIPDGRVVRRARPSSSPRSSRPRAGRRSTSRRRRSARPSPRPRDVPRGDRARSPPVSSRPCNVFDTGGERYPKIGELRPPRLLARAALRRRRGRAARADADRARPGAGGRRDRRDPPAPVRVHGPRPRRPAPAGVRARRSAAGLIFLVAVLAAAPPRARRPIANRSAAPVPVEAHDTSPSDVERVHR